MAIWKAKVAAGVRAYFKIVDASGNLVTGLSAGAFTALVINPADTANQAVAVAQSAQQAGVYYVDVPAAFLATHGPGAYGLSVGVHSVSPSVNDEVLLSLEVTTRDLDDLATVAGVWSAAPTDFTRLDVPVSSRAEAGAAMTLTAGERIAIASAVLTQDISPLQDSADLYSLLSAILKLVSKFDAKTGRTYRLDGVQTHMTQAPTVDATMKPIRQLDVAV